MKGATAVCGLGITEMGRVYKTAEEFAIEAVHMALDDAGLAWGDLRKLGSVLESPTIEHRDTVVHVDDRAGGSRPLIRTPYRMSETELGAPGSLAHQGEHTHEVLASWLSMSDDVVDRLLAERTLVQSEWASEGES